MHFVTVTLKDNRVVAINLDMIVSIEPVAKSELTKVWMVSVGPDRLVYYVQLTMEEWAVNLKQTKR